MPRGDCYGPSLRPYVKEDSSAHRRPYPQRVDVAIIRKIAFVENTLPETAVCSTSRSMNTTEVIRHFEDSRAMSCKVPRDSRSTAGIMA